MKPILLAIAACLVPQFLAADFSYDEKIYAIRALVPSGPDPDAGPVSSLHFFQASRKAEIRPDQTTITDLAAQTITVINHGAMTYAVAPLTLEPRTQGGAPPSTLRAVSKETGRAQTIQTLPCRELITTIQPGDRNKGAVYAIARWICTGIQGAGEAREFQRKLRQIQPKAAPASLAGALGEAWEQVEAYAAKTGGWPIQTLSVMRTGSDAVTAFDELQRELENGLKPKAATGSFTGLILDIRSECTNFSNAPIDPSRFAIPAGYKRAGK